MENNNNNNELNQNGAPEMVQESIWADGVVPQNVDDKFTLINDTFDEIKDTLQNIAINQVMEVTALLMI